MHLNISCTIGSPTAVSRCMSGLMAVNLHTCYPQRILRTTLGCAISPPAHQRI